MKLSNDTITALLSSVLVLSSLLSTKTKTTHGFSPVRMMTASTPTSAMIKTRSKTLYMGYLDDLSSELTAEDPNPVPDEESRDATRMSQEQLDRAGPGSWDSYVEFDEFDGGDGQMGVAGDGNKKLEKFDMTQMAKSKTMSAKNAWGKTTGYADTLIDQGMDTARAQQLENWHNQQEVLQQRKNQQYMTEQFDQVSSSADEDWRKLASFGVERNQDFDLDEAFGAVATGDKVEGVIELVGRMNGPYATHEFTLRNPYMGFADFRAAFTADTPNSFSVEPAEGSLRQKEDTNFLIKFKAQNPGTVEGYLVIETEDFKKTWKVVGSSN